MRLRIVLFGALGTLATVLAAAIVFVPGFVDGVEPLASVADALADVDRRQLLVAASVLVGLFVSVASWSASQAARGERDAFDEATAGPPEAVTVARQRLTGAGLDGAFDDAIDGDDDAAERVRDQLRETAARAYARSAGCEMEDARTTVRRGTWTDDSTAAAVLADGEGPSYSLVARLRLWLDPESERERRFSRAVRETTRIAGGQR